MLSPPEARAISEVPADLVRFPIITGPRRPPPPPPGYPPPPPGYPPPPPGQPPPPLPGHPPPPGQTGPERRPPPGYPPPPGNPPPPPICRFRIASGAISALITASALVSERSTP